MSIGVISLLVGMLVFMIGTTVSAYVFKPKTIELEGRLPSTEKEEILEILEEDVATNTKFGKFHKNYIRPQLSRYPNALQKISKMLGINMDILDSQIKEARLEKTFTVEEVVSMKLLGFSSMLIFLFMGLILNVNTVLILLGVISYLVGSFIPQRTITKKINQRRTQIEDELPDFLDLLKSVTEAGLVIQEAISKVTARMRGPLAEEFRTVMVESKVVGWRQAMENMAFRNDIESLSDVVSDILIAHEKGTSIVEILEKDALLMRQLKNARTQEKAKALSVKLLIPMAIFGFLPLFVLMVGPMIMQLMKNLS